MKRSILILAISAALMTPAFATGIFIPIGPPKYTPQPPIITPQAPIVTPQSPLVTPQPNLVTVTPGAAIPETSSAPTPGGGSEVCLNADIFGKVFVNGPQCFVPTSLVPTSNGGGYLPDVITETPQPDLITNRPDIITPQPDIVTPQPPICSQPCISIPGGFGSRPC